MNSVQEIRARLLQDANESIARTDDYEVHIKNILLIHPKTQCKCTNRLPRWLFLYIISVSLQDMDPAPDTSTIKYLICWILKAFLHTLRKAFLHMLFREAREYTKLRTVIKSHANKAKALCCDPLQVPSEVSNERLGLGSGQRVNKDKRKTALISGHFTYTGNAPVTLNMEAIVLFLLNQYCKQCKISTANVN